MEGQTESPMAALVKTAWVQLTAQVKENPGVVIFTESDLKCHLFRVLHALIEAGSLSYEITTERPYGLRYSNSMKKVDLLLTDLTSETTVLVELKCELQSRGESDDVKKLTSMYSQDHPPVAGFALAVAWTRSKSKLNAAPKFSVRGFEAFPIVESTMYLPLWEFYLHPFSNALRARIEAFVAKLQAQYGVAVWPVKPDQPTADRAALSVRAGNKVLFYLVFSKRTRSEPSGRPWFTVVYPSSPVPPKLRDLVPPDMTSTIPGVICKGSWEVDSALQVVEEVVASLTQPS